MYPLNGVVWDSRVRLVTSDWLDVVEFLSNSCGAGVDDDKLCPGPYVGRDVFCVDDADDLDAFRGGKVGEIAGDEMAVFKGGEVRLREWHPFAFTSTDCELIRCDLADLELPPWSDVSTAE